MYFRAFALFYLSWVFAFSTSASFALSLCSVCQVWFIVFARCLDSSRKEIICQLAISHFHICLRGKSASSNFASSLSLGSLVDIRQMNHWSIWFYILRNISSICIDSECAILLCSLSKCFTKTNEEVQHMVFHLGLDLVHIHFWISKNLFELFPEVIVDEFLRKDSDQVFFENEKKKQYQNVA